jgi:antitoxin component of MazEF toxin-antitoxin module
MRALQKLTTRGNSTGVSIPRTILHRLGWLPGESVIIEVLEDDSVRVRRPCERDFAPLGAPRLFMNELAAGQR